MVGKLQALERIDQSVREAVQQFADILSSLAGGELAGLTVYGLALSKAFDSSRHLLQSVAVMSAVDLQTLRQLASHGPKMARQRIAAPIIMTPQYVQDSRDTFPLELLEIGQQHATLLGEDYFRDLRLESEHLRLQCERELKVLLIGMRQALLASGGDTKRLEHVGERAAETLIRVLRGLLWLEGETGSLEAPQLVARAESVWGRELSGIRTLIQSAAGGGWEQFVGLYRELEVLRELVDEG
jgi:hypothetical protein